MSESVAVLPQVEKSTIVCDCECDQCAWV